MDAGERILLHGLGYFTRGEGSDKAGRNPRTGQPLTYTSYHKPKNAPSFSESRLCAEIAADCGLDASAAKGILESFKGVLKIALKKGDIVSMLGFGSFFVGRRAARNGRNPQTGATIRIIAARVPKFRSTKARNKGGKFSPATAPKEAVN